MKAYDKREKSIVLIPYISTKKYNNCQGITSAILHLFYKSVTLLKNIGNYGINFIR